MFVLDASALLRWIDDESGAARIDEVLIAHFAGSSRTVMSALHFGEVLGVLLKRYGARAGGELNLLMGTLEIEVISATRERAERSAIIRHRLKMPYVDSFAVELAASFPEHLLLTGDFDFKPAEHDIQLEFLPPKRKST